MSSVPLELEQALHRLDRRSALLLEQLVRDALALVGEKGKSTIVQGKDWPASYFDETAGSFANEPLDIPADSPPSADPDW